VVLSLPVLQASRGAAPPLAEKKDNSPEDLARDMEKQVHRLIEASAQAVVKRDFPLALEKAKEAAKKERALCRHRETSNLADHINLDLTYAVCLNLAYAYQSNHMQEEVGSGGSL
jgi:intraflagellar transport protein 88